MIELVEELRRWADNASSHRHTMMRWSDVVPLLRDAADRIEELEPEARPETQRFKSHLPRFVAAGEAAIIAASGPLAFPEPQLSDREQVITMTAQLFLAMRELCLVHGSDPDAVWELAKRMDLP